MLYEIRIQGHLSDVLLGQGFPELKGFRAEGCTVLIGHLTDNGQLLTVLRRLRALGLHLLDFRTLDETPHGA